MRTVNTVVNANKAKIMKINELPVEIFQKLYNLRFKEGKNIPYDEYISRFSFVVVGGKVYHDNSERSKEMELEYFKHKHGSLHLLYIPEAIVDSDGVVIKNRYGYQEI